MISLICVYNRKEEFDSMVYSLKNQTIKYEIIGIDNTNGKFKSASSALNYGANLAKGEILVFLHQDIEFLKEDSLEKFLEIFQQDENTIVGIAGAKHNKKNLNEKYNLVETLDECIVAMKKNTYNKLKFNEELCDNWHLYVVEMCLRAKINNIKCVEQIDNSYILHKSIGNIDERYMQNLKKIMKTYTNEKYIATTCKSMPNNMLYYYSYYLAWKIKKVLLGNYPLIHKIKKIIKR